MFFKYLVDLARNPALFWDTLEEAANVFRADLEKELEVEGELASLWDTMVSSMRQVAPLAQNRLVHLYYEKQTREWIQAALSSDDPHQVAVNILERIAHVLKGQSKPLFVPFTIATPNPEWLEHLQAGGAVEALEKIEGVSLEQILSRLDADTALVHVITSDIGTYAIITCRSVPPEMLLCKTLTRARLENLLRGWMWLYYWHREHYYYKTIERIIERRKMSKDEGEAFREAAIRIPYRCIFYNQYLFERLQPTEVPTAEGIPMVPFPSWLLMEAILRELGKGDIVSSEGLWQRVNERLFARGIRRIILCPDKALALFPHHAAILNVEIDGQKEFLLDRYEIVYLPPGAFAQSRPTTPQVQRLLVFGTDNEALLELGIASLHSLLPDRIIEWHASRVSETPRKQFADALSRLNVDALTFLGHGEYDWQNPSRSYLGILSDGKNGFNSVITLGFLRSHMPSRLRVIVLIGCETGLPQVIASSYKGFAEDLISLPSVSTVISTLWPVRDVSTLLLIRQFHRYWLLSNLPTGEEGCSPGKALRKAQRWLRMLTREEAISELEMLTSIYATKEIDKEIHILRESFVERPYAHPYFWSPFYVTGDIQ